MEQRDRDQNLLASEAARGQIRQHPVSKDRPKRTENPAMPEKPDPVRKLSEKNTKQEMLDAYQALLKQFQEKRAAELAPARQLEEKRVQEAVRVAETLSPAGIERDLGSLKAEIGRLLADLAPGRFRGEQILIAIPLFHSSD